MSELGQHISAKMGLKTTLPQSPQCSQTETEYDYTSIRGESTQITYQFTNTSQKLKSRIRYLRLLTRLAGTAIAITTAVQEGQTIRTFLTTRNEIRDGRGPWSKETQLWSSIMMFSLSVITTVFGIGIVCAYFFSIKAANSISDIQGRISIVADIGHLAVWIGIAVAYRVAKNGRDLWGWACSPIAQSIQPEFEGLVSFKNVCSRGVWLLHELFDRSHR